MWLARENPTKSGYLTFDSGRAYTINRWLNRGQVSEYSRSTRFTPSSDPSKKPTGLSNIPLSEDSCNRLTCTPILGDSYHKRGTKRLTQTNRSAVNIDESSSMTSVKFSDAVEASSATLHLPPEVGINQVG